MDSKRGGVETRPPQRYGTGNQPSQRPHSHLKLDIPHVSMSMAKKDHQVGEIIEPPNSWSDPHHAHSPPPTTAVRARSILGFSRCGIHAISRRHGAQTSLHRTSLQKTNASSRTGSWPAFFGLLGTEDWYLRETWEILRLRCATAQNDDSLVWATQLPTAPAAFLSTRPGHPRRGTPDQDRAKLTLRGRPLGYLSSRSWP